MHSCRKGFTLIELSIVLVIIGLIIGGVMVGRDLIVGAGVRAQISQIEKYNAAASTFYSKYDCLPGDCANAAQYGFAARGQYAGEGDGNGVIEGVWQNWSGSNLGIYQGVGETAMFWVDLSAAHLIDGSFSAATSFTFPFNAVSATGVGNYMPSAKMGNGIYVFASSGGVGGGDTTNYFMLSGVTGMDSYGDPLTTNTLKVNQSYMIDQKIDDGFPMTGKIKAQFIGGGFWWVGQVNTNATSGSATTCYDNGNVSGATQQYSMEQNNGAGLNCALSFQMQGAAR